MNKFSYMQVSDKIDELITINKKDQSVDAYVATTGTLRALLGMMVSGVATAENVMSVLDNEIAQGVK